MVAAAAARTEAEGGGRGGAGCGDTAEYARQVRLPSDPPPIRPDIPGEQGGSADGESDEAKEKAEGAAAA